MLDPNRICCRAHNRTPKSRVAAAAGRLACIVWHSKRATRCSKSLADGTFEVPDRELFGLSPSALVKRFGPTGGRESRIGLAIHVWLEGKVRMTEVNLIPLCLSPRSSPEAKLYGTLNTSRHPTLLLKNLFHAREKTKNLLFFKVEN